MNSFIVTLCIAFAFVAVMAYPNVHEHHGEGGGAHGGHDGGDGGHHTVPNYKYEYGVHDPHTKDHKSQDEQRHHDDVKGSYTIHDPDGTKRIVEYTSGKHDGFQAVVQRDGVAKHPAVYGKHGDGHGHDGGHGEHGEEGTSYVKVTHWGHGSGR